MIDFQGIAQDLSALELLSKWLPNGKLHGREYKIGNVRGDPGESLSINIDTGAWADFAAGQAGGDLISLYAAIHNISQSDAAKELSPNSAEEFAPNQKCLKFPKSNYGKPSLVWEYPGYGYIFRYDMPDGKKQFTPLTCWRQADGSLKWKWKKFPDPMPLYWAGEPKDKILIVEGEKTADAAQKLLPPDWVAITWPGGSGAAKKANWKTF